MVSLLLPVIYLAFISLGLPDALLGAAWPSMYPQLGAGVSWAGGAVQKLPVVWPLTPNLLCWTSLLPV